LNEKCFIIQYTSDTGMFTVFTDKQKKERILGENWPKDQGTDRTVGYLYRCTPNLEHLADPSEP